MSDNVIADIICEYVEPYWDKDGVRVTVPIQHKHREMRRRAEAAGYFSILPAAIAAIKENSHHKMREITKPLYDLKVASFSDGRMNNPFGTHRTDVILCVVHALRYEWRKTFIGLQLRSMLPWWVEELHCYNADTEAVPKHYVRCACGNKLRYPAQHCMVCGKMMRPENLGIESSLRDRIKNRKRNGH